MSKKIIFLILIFASSLFSLTLEQNLNNNEKIFVGTPIHLNVEIETTLQDSVAFEQVDTLDVFEVLNFDNQIEIVDNKKKNNYNFALVSFETGKQTIPPLKFFINKKDSLSTKPEIVNIQSVITDSTKNIADIQPLFDINLSIWNYLVPIFILILVVIGIIYLVKFLKSKDKKETIVKKIDKRTPYEKTLPLLQKLKKSDLLIEGQLVKFNFELSYILRFFLEENYKINALEMTTYEIKTHLKIEHDEKRDILHLLNKIDIVKFAKGETTKQTCRENLSWFENYLEKFKFAEKKAEVIDA